MRSSFWLMIVAVGAFAAAGILDWQRRQRVTLDMLWTEHYELAGLKRQAEEDRKTILANQWRSYIETREMIPNDRELFVKAHQLWRENPAVGLPWKAVEILAELEGRHGGTGHTVSGWKIDFTGDLHLSRTTVWPDGMPFTDPEVPWGPVWGYTNYVEWKARRDRIYEGELIYPKKRYFWW